MNKKKLILFLSITLIIVGIGLLIWLEIGQFQAQMRYDGQYISFRTIADISLWGYLGIPCFFVGIGLFKYWVDN